MWEPVASKLAYFSQPELMTTEKQIAIAVVIFFIFTILRKIFAKYVFKGIIRLSNRSSMELDTKALVAFEKPLHGFFVVVGLYASLTYLPLSLSWDLLISRLVRSSNIILLAWGLYNFVDSTNLFAKMEEKLDIDIDKVLAPFLSKVLKFIIIVMAVGVVAQEWNYDVSGFIAGLGLGGLAFALAAKDTAANIFGGIVIIVDKPFSIGDWIVGSGVEGTVEDITFRSTKIRTFGQAVVTVPNSSLVNSPVTNWSRMGRRRITFKLGVTYTTPRHKLARCVKRIREMLESHPEIHPQTIFVYFDDFNESSLDIFLYFFTVTTNWGEFLRVKEDVNFKIMAILEEEGVSVAFPSRSIYLEKPVFDKQINLADHHIRGSKCAD